jgi:glyoxylase-like metal-dependent hydrolase (beta-lactamase superfamily II)
MRLHTFSRATARTAIATIVVLLCLAPGARQQLAGQSAGASDVIARAATALGGRDRLLAIKTLTIEGYGQLAYQNGGGNITASPDAPQKWINIQEYARVIQLDPLRTRVRQRQANDFVFAAAANMRGVVSTQALDGDLAFNLNAQGNATRAGAAAVRTRRLEALAHPVALVRTALAASTRVGARRTSGNLQLVDLTIPAGDTLTLAVDSVTSLPAWISWVGSDTNLGDVVYRAHFTGYQPVSGVMMPTGFNTTIDFRNVVLQKIYVDRHAVDAATDDLAAPASLRTTAAPAPSTPAAAPPAPQIGSTELARGIWYLTGAGNSTLFEFADHLTLFEVYASEANARAVIARARSLVPNKPLTEVIISHHHFDHSGGLRAAVAEGLTIVTHRGNEALFRELVNRPARLAPDALARKPRPIKFRLVDDHLPMKDASMAIDVYRVVANSHMADALMVHVPGERLLVQGDLFDASWEVYWWGSSYMDNLRHRNIQVDRDVPVHGRVLPIAEVQQGIERQIKNAQNLCASVASAGLGMKGCPVKTTVDR